MKKLYYIFLCLAVVISYPACSTDKDITEDDSTPNTSTNENDLNDDFKATSKDTTFTDAVTVIFSGESVSVENPYSNKGVSISTSGAKIVVNSSISTEITYVLNGYSTDGSFKIYSNSPFSIALNGVNLICSDGSVINNQSKQQATISLVGESTNRLIDNNIYSASEEDQKGTIFSEGGLVFSGKGALTLKGYYKHAICSDDYINLSDGDISIKSAYKDGIHAKEYCLIKQGVLSIVSTDDGINSEEGDIQIEGGNITLSTSGEGAKGIKSTGNTIISGGDINISTTGSAYYDSEEQDIKSSSGIKTDNNLEITNGNLTINSSGAGGKGINADGKIIIGNGSIKVTTTGDQFRYGNDDTAAKAIKADGDIIINGGNITVKTSKTEAEGIESKSTITISNGTIEVVAYDDCINASDNITINGGNIYCYSSSNDGIDSNGTLTIAGGVVISSGSTSPEEGFDCDNNTFKITGGIVIGTGGATSTPTSSVSTQYSVEYGGSGSNGQLIHIESTKGESILTYKIPRSYSSQMTLLFSSPNLSANTTYTIYSGGSVSGGSEFNGYYTGSTYTKGSTSNTFTTSSKVTTVGNVSSGGGGGGWRP
ncbi:carbohydrate-binding domain-containing protein [Massilibacteroides sp.]|uniref:carbohydrate-binding domain-containing protein n=1 Tax=Massilibacteroides sp. TaxID=2034766 RepID=UPI00261F2A82|nr:carbohydrate-binding domain-containing protein [Massilibacteroides sp.]MDD4514848.1 carbohydrate-binding domain-containing protein [Massilibacteroides sp.]